MGLDEPIAFFFFALLLESPKRLPKCSLLTLQGEGADQSNCRELDTLNLVERDDQ